MKLEVSSAASAAPSQGAQQSSAEPDAVTDAAGRKLTLREPSILQESRLVRALGDVAANAAYMALYVMPASMVAAIDGEPCEFPATPMQVEAAIQRVGRGGIAAVMKYVSARAENAEATIKKSAATTDSEAPAGS